MKSNADARGAVTGAGIPESVDEIFLHTREELNLALASARMGTWNWDVPRNQLLWDKQMHEFFGIEAGTFGGHLEDFLNLVYVEDRGRVAEAMAAALAESADLDGEFRVVRASDGGTRHLRARSKVLCDGQGKPLRVIGVAWDITGQKQTEEQIAREHLLLRAMMEYIPDKIYFKDTESRFICVNKAKLVKHGLTDVLEMLGKTDFDFFTKERAQQALEDEKKIMTTGEPLVDQEEKDVWPDGSETWVSTTKLPLRDAGGRVIGTFGLSRDITRRKRAEEQLARSTEELRLKNEALEEDLEMARELQSSMLPQRYPSFPHDAAPEKSALHFHHYYHPSMAVGGDFFDILEISDDAAGVLICDVMGHGVRAALVAATVHAVIGELRTTWTNPAEFLLQINRALRSSLKNTGMPLFASAFYMVADLSRGDLRYANAGHPHPLRVRHSAAAPEITRLEGKTSPALGLFDDANCTNSHCELSLHDVILLFTDGLFEVEGREGQFFDHPLLLSAVSKRSDLSIEKLCTGVVEEVQSFSASKEFTDDVCLVAMKVDRLAAK